MLRTPRGVVVALLVLALSGSMTVLATPAAQAQTQAQTQAQAPAATHSWVAKRFSLHRARSVLSQAQHTFTPRSLKSTAPRSTDATMLLRDLAKARNTLTGAQRQQADRLLARPTNGSGDDTIKYGRVKAKTACKGQFCVHWVTSGVNRISTVNRNHNRLPDYVDNVFTTMNYVYSREVRGMHYRRPLYDTATVGQKGNPDRRIDIYLGDLTRFGLYGYCTPEGSGYRAAGYCVLDNNFTGYGTTPIKAMRVTAAHEFFHDIQFAYNAWQDDWFMEATAAWMEDEVYDYINDNLQYLPFSPIRHPGLSADYSTDLYRYGDWILFKYISERLGRDTIRRIWYDAATTRAGHYSLASVHRVVARQRTWSAFAARFAVWNLLLPHTYSERSIYPTPAVTRSATLGPGQVSTSSSTLRHMAREVVKLTPSSSVPVGARLTVTATAPTTTHGAYALVETISPGGTVRTYPISLTNVGPTSTGSVSVPFAHSAVAHAYLIGANTSTSMSDCGSVFGDDGTPEYSCGGTGTYDSGQPSYAFTAVAH